MKPTDFTIIRHHQFVVYWGDTDGDAYMPCIQSVRFVRDPGWWSRGILELDFLHDPSVVNFLRKAPKTNQMTISMGSEGRKTCLLIDKAKVSGFAMNDLDYHNGDPHMITARISYSRLTTIPV